MSDSDPYNTYHLWLHIARLREASGDAEGAARARRTARRLPNRRLRRHLNRNVKGRTW